MVAPGRSSDELRRSGLHGRVVCRVSGEHVLSSALQVLVSADIDVGPALVGLLSDGDPNLRMHAALALGQLRSHGAVSALIASLQSWDGYLTASIQYSVDQGELPGLSDAAQLAFELQAFFDHANTTSVLLDSEEPYHRAARAIADRLRALGAAESAISELVA